MKFFPTRDSTLSQNRKIMSSKPRTLLAAFAGWLAASTAADAQVVTTPLKDETVQLSPFEVTADKDNGYRANGTLAGTRLRTELKDVAASVSVVTKDFMNDIGATNLAELLVYTTGTEVSGLGGNMSSFDVSAGGVDPEQVNRQPASIVRIRAIGSGTSGSDQARDFFTTEIPSDGYNIDRVEINRGPNAMLFGLGSPSGVVNASLIKANTQRNATSLEFKYGRFGTSRASLDHNQVLLKNKLALRFATLTGDQKFMQKPAFDRNERYYGTATYKPFATTTIKVNTEYGRRVSDKPENWLPNSLVGNWIQMGKPAYDPTTSRLTFLGTPPAVSSIIFPGALTNGAFNGGRNGTLTSTLTDAIYVVNENPNVRSLGITGYKERGVIGYEFNNARLHPNFLTTPNATDPLVSDAMVGIGSPQDFIRRLMTGLTGAPNSTNWTPANMTYNFWKTPRYVDTAVYDYFTQLIEGPNKQERSRWKTYNATIEQRIGSRAGVEFAVDWQYMDAAFNNPSNYTINVDINTKLLDGTTNPNFARPFYSAVGWAASETRDRKGARATAYYDLDLRPYAKGWFAKFLGRHVFTGNISSAEFFIQSFGGRPLYSGTDYLDSEQASNAGTTAVVNRAFSADKRAIWPLNYLGPSLVASVDGRNAGIQNVRVNTSANTSNSILTRYYQSPVINSQAPAQWQDKAFNTYHNASDWDFQDGNGQYTISRRSSKSLSKVLIANSRLLDDNLITTLGWRSDDFKAYDAGAPNRDLNSNVAMTDYKNWPLLQAVHTKVNTFNYGLVGHVPKFITQKLPDGVEASLTYNKSDNSSPTSPRTGLDGQVIAAPTGKTKEFGGRLALFQGKLEVRVINFETTAANSTNSNLRNPQNAIQRQVNATYQNIAAGNANRINTDPQPYNNGLPNTPGAVAAQKAWNDFFAAPFGQQFLNTFLYKNVGTSTQTHDDRVDTVVSTSDVVAKGWDYEVTYNPTKNWRISANASQSVAIRSNTGAALNEFGDQMTVLMQGPAGSIPNGGNSTTALRDIVAQQVVDIKKELALDGSPSPEARKWRYNFVSNYTITEGRLKDVKIGGAIRWQDKVAIGYPVINVPVGTVTFNPLNDVKHPYYGPTETNYDAWIGYSRRLPHEIKWSLQLNVRNLGVNRKLIPVAAQPDGSVAVNRIAEPMTWTLSSRFEF